MGYITWFLQRAIIGSRTCRHCSPCCGPGGGLGCDKAEHSRNGHGGTAAGKIVSGEGLRAGQIPTGHGVTEGEYLQK